MTRRRAFKIIVTENWFPETEETTSNFVTCSTVGIKFNYKGEQYSSYMAIDKTFLCDDEVAKAAAAIILSALETMRNLEADDAKE